VRVRLVEDPPAAWNDFVAQHPAGTLFHDARWAKIVNGVVRRRPFHLMAEDDAGVCGVLPLFQVRSPLTGRCLVSSPCSVYGGILARDGAVRTAIVERLRQLVREQGFAYAELRQHADAPADAPRSDLYVTFIRDLPQEADDCLLMIPRKSRATTRQARDRHGLVFVEGWNLFDTFYELFVLNKRSLGSPSYSRAFFLNFFDYFADEVVLHGVQHAGRVIGAVMSFVWKDTLLAYYSGARQECEQTGAMNFLYWKLMEYATLRGLKKFDFGRSRAETGAYHFKRNMGFEPTPLPYWFVLGEKGQLPNVNPGNPRFHRIEELWSKLPMPLVKWVGPRLMRFLP
jgi:FemAB-related protein (PEP-CTERM system-associated)